MGKYFKARSASLAAQDVKFVIHRDREEQPECRSWWESTVVNLRIPELRDGNDGSKKRKFDGSDGIRVSMLKPSAQPAVQESPKRRRLSGEAALGPMTPSRMNARSGLDDVPEEPLGPDQQQAAEEGALEMIRSQYLDHLYLKKTTTEYFEKGPLSRAKAVFGANPSTKQAKQSLCDFLVDSVLPLNLLDKKYKETIPQMAEDLNPRRDGRRVDNTTTSMGSARKQRRTQSAKSAKVKRNGLFPTEDEYVLKWRHDFDCEKEEYILPGELETELKKKMLDLRVREMKMQIRLIRQVGVLRKAIAADPSEPVPEARPEDDMRVDGETKAGKRAKKPLDLGRTLEILADRLAITRTLGQGVG
ncbi:MAG: hypothetical protein M1825_003514 [Sarcosagium campestre]|nr:MAG: hypothetical protein M1825_003514 [Sarcosagium campestre]